MRVRFVARNLTQPTLESGRSLQASYSRTRPERARVASSAEVHRAGGKLGCSRQHKRRGPPPGGTRAACVRVKSISSTVFVPINKQRAARSVACAPLKGASRARYVRHTGPAVATPPASRAFALAFASCDPQEAQPGVYTVSTRSAAGISDATFGLFRNVEAAPVARTPWHQMKSAESPECMRMPWKTCSRRARAVGAMAQLLIAFTPAPHKRAAPSQARQ